jgi:hypothetical protein
MDPRTGPDAGGNRTESEHHALIDMEKYSNAQAWSVVKRRACRASARPTCGHRMANQGLHS